MKKFLAVFLALFAALMLTAPTYASGSTTIMTRVNFEHPVQNNSRFYKDTWIDNGLFRWPFYMLANPSDLNVIGNYGKFVLQSTLGQDTVYTIPDPGTYTANFVLDTNQASTLISHITVQLTAAQIIAAYATPVLLIPAVTGENINIHIAQLTTTTTSTAFTGGANTGLQLGSTVHGGGTVITGTIATTCFTSSAGTYITRFLPIAVGPTAAASSTGLGLYWSPATANAAGTGTGFFDIWYSQK